MGTAQITSLILLFVVSTNLLFSEGVEPSPLQPKRSSGFKPLSEIEVLRQQQHHAQRKDKQQDLRRHPEIVPTRLQYSVGVKSLAGSDSQKKVQKDLLPTQQSSHSTATLFLMSVLGVAFVNAVGAVWYLKRRKQIHAVPKPKPPIIFSPLSEMAHTVPSVEKKNNHVAEYRLHEKAGEENHIAPQRISSEMELVHALRELKRKYQAKELKTVVKKKPSKKRTPPEAKKLGIGIGEVELANRLEQMKRKYNKKETHND